MSFLVLRTSVFVNVIIIVVGILVSGFLLLFGIANLINPDVPDAYLTQNTMICLLVSCIGIAFLLLAIASFRGIVLKKKDVTKENKNITFP